MSYDVGTFVDLTGINKKTAEAPNRRKKSDFENQIEGFAVGTSFTFKLTPTGIRAAIQIPVAFA